MQNLVEALRYKLEGRGVDSRWGHWNISLHYGTKSQQNTSEAVVGFV